MVSSTLDRMVTMAVCSGLGGLGSTFKRTSWKHYKPLFPLHFVEYGALLYYDLEDIPENLLIIRTFLVEGVMCNPDIILCS